MTKHTASYTQQHIDADTWQNYVTTGLDYATQAAVEAHIAACRHCQQLVAALSPTAGAQAWASVRQAITRPRQSWTLRLLRRAGVPNDDLVVLGASDNLRLPWAVAIGGALATVVAAANLGRYEELGFLLLGPLVPALAVLAAYDTTDPLRRLTESTPYSKLRLGLLRTIATLVVALPTTVGLSVAVPGLRELAWIWLLPSLGLTGAMLIALRWLRTWPAGVLVAGVWTGTVLTVARAGQLAGIGSAPGQLTFAILAALSAVVFATANGAPHLPGTSRRNSTARPNGASR